MKLRNKLMGLAVAAVMVVSAAVGLTPATAHAAGAKVSLVPQKTEVQAGETVVVDVVLSENTGMCYLDMDFTYNKDAFKLESVVDKALLSDYFEANEGDLIWMGYRSNVTANGVLATLTFTALENEGTFNFGLTVAECYDTATNDVAITAAGTQVTIAHEHAFGAWTVETAATCGAAGLEVRTCACGEKETRVIPATGAHTYGDWTVTKEATCTEAGSKVRECACGHKETATIAAKGHAYTEVVTEATCTEAGSKVNVCECGDKVVVATIPAKGHVDANNDGKCDDCDTELPKAPVEDDDKDDKPSSPATGDNSMVMLWIAVMAAAVVVFNKKRINA